ncbi:MAG: hypothetical protein U1B80_05510, partial [Anaerolineaceae bacterium]|nr:hypothetical protein [Anaerolineaceae bacterium]
ELAHHHDQQGIHEIALNLWNTDPKIQSDCIKVLYEIGYLFPELIATYGDDFLKLLKSRNNRLVWGSMIALSTIAALKADDLFTHYKEIVAVMEKGSVITVDNGIKVLAALAAHNSAFSEKIFPYLIKHLAACRPKDVPQHAEITAVAVAPQYKAGFIGVLEKRMEDMNPAQAARLKRIIQAAGQR